ncbi:uncharacterized protein LOC125441526 [Sphaerodactylus townsendi]|uniref:uncharacterized protein LOC125441526 n=1 Tax=Sphaerodactylus townsendi TaxID=933632 RepID=UPI0020263459|nr:uncharacterized protein LOC125441526 [Sphaerodactylus townsendi]
MIQELYWKPMQLRSTGLNVLERYCHGSNLAGVANEVPNIPCRQLVSLGGFFENERMDSGLANSYVTFPGKSFYGAWTADVTFSLLSTAKQQCSSLGRACNIVVSLRMTGHLSLMSPLADVELPSFKEKLLISLQDAPSPQRRASLQEAKDACYLQKERCTGVLSLHGAYYLVAGTVLVDSPGSGAILYVKSACSAGFCGDKCQKRCPPICLSGRTHNPLTGQCDGLLSCTRQFSPSCLHGLVNSRCPHNPGWWFWDGHCYYVEEHSSESWQGAKAACDAHGKHVGLLTLTSAKEKGWIMNMVQKESWIGLNDADKDGTWTWAEGQDADLSPSWLTDVQLISGGCLGIGPQGEQNLAVSSCSELKPWICKAAVAPQSSCPTEPGWRSWNDSCYFWDSSLVSGWHEALQVCQRFRKTELLYLTSLQEKEWISSNFEGSFWTGLNDLKDESVFRWTTQEPLNQPLAMYLHDDMADGGLKDCVWFDTGTGFLIDASCKEKKPFLCKCSETTDWFDKQSGRGAAGDLDLLYPSMENLEQAKQECLLERSVCVAVLQTDKGFYLISSMEDIISKPGSTLYTLSICAKGFSGPHCQKALMHPQRPACDCSGRFQTTAKEVCGILVQSCVDDCRRMTTWKNCSLCLPACTEASLKNLDPEELALITMIQFRASQSLNLTTEDERDRENSSNIIYDPRYP